MISFCQLKMILTSTVGQRYGVLLKTHSTATQNFAMLGMMDPNGFDPTVTPPIANNVTGALVYNRMLLAGCMIDVIVADVCM